jgi:hypothetical protein
MDRYQTSKELHDAGYLCGTCGDLAYIGKRHECPKPQASDLTRIAQALERIANILEATHVRY